VSTRPEFIDRLIEVIIQQTLPYIIGQIDAGAEVIQLFDSWANVLDYDGYKRFVEKPTKILVSEIRKARPNIPIICFPKDIRYLSEFCKEIRPDAVSLGPEVSMEEAKELQKLTVVQGNLDPTILVQGDKTKIRDAINNIMQNLSGERFIFNLGHGILPQTPIENVEYLVSLVRNYE
jgi:uroporphyrinogen decarboxylase